MSVPEVELAVGKIGRVESPLDPAPISMVETVIEYKSEYRTDQDGNRRFRYDEDADRFVRDDQGGLIPDRTAARSDSGATRSSRRRTSGTRSWRPRRCPASPAPRSSSRSRRAS